MERVLNAPVSAPKEFSRPNEVAFRNYIEVELADTYRKSSHLIIPSSFYLGFQGVTGKQVVLGLNGSDEFTISIDGATAFALASSSSVTAVQSEVTAARQGEASLTAKVTQLSTATSTVDGKLSASYALTVDGGGRIASMKLLSDGTTSSVKFVASTFTIYDGTSDVAMFEVSGGAAYVAGSKVRTESMGANSVTQGSVQENDSDLSFGTTTWTTAAQVSITTPDANSLVFLPFSVFMFGDVDGSLAEGRILRDASVIYQTDLAGNPAPFDYEFTDEGYILYQPTFAGQVSGFDTDEPGAAGTYTYYFQIRTNGSSATWVANRRRLLALLFKR